MKKTMKYFALAITGAIIFSCGKEEAGEIVPAASDAQEQTSGENDNPVDPAIDGNLLTSFSVNFESLVDEAGTKVSVNLGTGVTAIENGDEVLVCNDEGGNAVYVYDGTEFSAKSGETPVALSTAVSVYYPADEFELDGTAVKFVMPGGVEASGDLGAIAPMAGVIAGEAGAYNVTLFNLASLLKVSVTADVNINSVSLDYGSGVNYAEGAKFTVDASAKTLTAADASSETSVTVALGTPAATADVVFLLPTVELANGLAVTANLADNHNGGADSFTISNASTDAPARKKVSTMSFYAGLFSGGAGTAGDPYIIAKARDFKYISKYCAEGYTPGSKDAASFLGATYKQIADINFNNADLSAYMIGGASTPFTGTYNGNSKTLSNFTITGTPSGNEGVAPFKAINGAVLQNIAISGASVTGGKFTAGLVGYATGASLTIQNCSIEGSTIADTGHDYGVGGLIGGLYGGTVTGCSGTDLTISTTASGKRYFGGLISYINGTVTVSGCELNGTTTITNAYQSGGIVGQINNENVTVTDCHNHSDINASGCNYIGGILGYATTGTVSHCSNDGDISGANSIAGIIGYFNGKVANVTGCVNTGDITATSNYAGGIVAYIKGGNVSDSRSDATIVASSNGAGGIIGGMDGDLGIKVQSCFAKGNVKGTTQVGGFVGLMQADAAYIVNCLAAANVVATGKESNQAAGGFVGYLKNATNGKNAWIGNCAVYDVIVKAPNQTSNTSPVRVGGFAGVHNFTTTRSNSMIQNCYYQGVAENLGYGGGDDFTTKPTTINGSYHGGIAGYSAGYLLDCYSTPKVKANGSGGTYTNNTTLTQEFIYGNTNSNPAITTSTSVNIAANTTTLGGILSAVDATYSSMAFSDWDSYEEGGKHYYYPASLTALGVDFYKK